MTPSMSDREFWNLVQIEEETNCDISAGPDLGPHLGEYLAAAINYIDDRKLIALLQSELSGVLSSEEIEAIANGVQAQVRRHIQRKSA
jgi:hypothetical protein